MIFVLTYIIGIHLENLTILFGIIVVVLNNLTWKILGFSIILCSDSLLLSLDVIDLGF